MRIIKSFLSLSVILNIGISGRADEAGKLMECLLPWESIQWVLSHNPGCQLKLELFQGNYRHAGRNYTHKMIQECSGGAYGPQRNVTFRMTYTPAKGEEPFLLMASPYQDFTRDSYVIEGFANGKTYLMLLNSRTSSPVEIQCRFF